MKTENREALMDSDYEFSEHLLFRLLKDEVQSAEIPTLPKLQPMNDEREQLLEQMAEIISDIGDNLDRDIKFNKVVENFALVADGKSFQRLAKKVFFDGITWGKIITFICAIGKTVAKIIANSLPSIVSWTLDFFRDDLLNWICSRGGWVNSISALARYSFERDFGSSSSPISLSSGVIFISGVLLGGLIVWRLKRGA